MDDFGFVEAVYRFGQSVIVRVTDAANRRLDPRERQPLGIAKGQILPPTVGVMNGLAPFPFRCVAHVMRRSFRMRPVILYSAMNAACADCKSR